MSWWNVVSSPLKDAVAKNVGTIMSDVERAIGIPSDGEEEKEENFHDNKHVDSSDFIATDDLPFIPDEPDEEDIKKDDSVNDEWNWKDEEPKNEIKKPKKLRKPLSTPSIHTEEEPEVSMNNVKELNHHEISKETSRVEENEPEVKNVETEIVKEELEEIKDGNKLDNEEEINDKESEIISKNITENNNLLEEKDNIIEKLKKQLASREAQMESIGTMASQSNSENHQLKDKLAALELKYKQLQDNSGNLEDLKKEFSERLGKEQKTITDLKNQIQNMKKESTKKSSNSSNDEDKDKLIEELRNEGITLSKKQLQLEKIIKQLRQKEKESDNQITKLTERAEKAEKKAEENSVKLKEMTYSGKSANDTIIHLKQLSEANIKKLEKQEQIIKESNSRIESLESALEKAWQDLAEQRKINLGKETEAEQSVFEAQSAVKEELTSLLRQQQAEFQERENALNQTIEELRNELSHMESKHFRNEELLQRELQELQRKYMEQTSNIDHLGTDNEALQALHREMDSIRSSQEANKRVWESLEQILRNRIKEEEEKAEEAMEKERTAQVELNNAVIELKRLESKLSIERKTTLRHQANYEAIQVTLEETQKVVEELKMKLEKTTNMYDSVVSSSRQKEQELEKEISQLRESEQNLRNSYTKQLKEAEQKNTQSSFADTSAPKFTSRRVQSSFESLGSTTLPSGMKSSASYERSQALIKQYESEIISLKEQIERLENSKQNLEDQLVKLTATNDHNVLEIQNMKQMKIDYEEMENRHKILMELYGAKEEAVEELRDDIKEMKQIYQMQINDLVIQLEQLKKK